MQTALNCSQFASLLYPCTAGAYRRPSDNCLFPVNDEGLTLSVCACLCVCELDVRRTQVQAINFNEKHLHFDFRKTQGKQKHEEGAARGKGCVAHVWVLLMQVQSTQLPQQTIYRAPPFPRTLCSPSWPRSRAICLVFRRIAISFLITFATVTWLRCLSWVPLLGTPFSQRSLSRHVKQFDANSLDLSTCGHRQGDKRPGQHEYYE